MLPQHCFARRFAEGFLTIVAILSFSIPPAYAQFNSIIQQAIGAAITQGLGQQGQPQYRYPQRQIAPSYRQETQQQGYGNGPSFDCRRASEAVAITICSDPELSRLDREMADAYVAQLHQGGDPAALKENQRAWREGRNACRTDRACLASSLRERIAQLRGSAPASPYAKGDDFTGQSTTPDVVPDGLILPHLQTLRGLPVLGGSDGQDEARWFMLLALSIEPDALSRNAEAYATRFLPYQNPVGGSGSWHSSNEFAESDTRQRFLARYGSTLMRSAVRLPQRIFVFQHVSFDRYDPERHGFPLPPRKPIYLQVPSGTHLNIVGNIAFDGDFWPISEQSARALLSSSQTLARHDATLATEIYLEASGHDPSEIKASWTEAYLVNPDTNQILADLGAPAPALPAAPLELDQKDPFVAWTHPPEGIAPWHFKSVDGAVAFTEKLTLMRMIAAGNLGDYLSRANFYFQQAGLAQEMLLPATYSSIFYAGANLNGKDEFEKQRSSDRLRGYLTQLRSMAPKAPFDVTIIENGSLAQYNQSAGGFGINTSKNLGLSDIASEAGLSLKTSFAWPDFFWPIPPDRAERALRSQPDRDVKLAARIRIDSVDPVTGATAVTLKSLTLYGKALAAPLYRFPVTIDDPTAASASGLAFKREPSLDQTLLCAEVLSLPATFDRQRIDNDCTRVIAARDALLYADSTNLHNLHLGDAEAPFLPRSIPSLADVDRPALGLWARKYIAAAHSIAVQYLPSLSQRVATGISFEAVGHSENPTGQGFTRILQRYQIRPEQLVHYGRLGDLPVYFITPNLAHLYNIVVPFSRLKPDTSGGHPSAELTLGDAELTTNDSGSPLLLLKVVPKSLVVRSEIGDKLMDRDFADIPTFGEKEHQKVNEEARALDYSLVDLLAIKAMGDKLHPEAVAYMMKRRWEYEHAQTGSIDRFFTIGQPFPGVDEIPAQSAAFVAWAVAHAPSLPVPVTLTSALDLSKSDQQIPWRQFECVESSYSGNLPATNYVARAAYERLQCERKKDTADDSARDTCSGIDDLLMKSDLIGQLKGVCRRPDLHFSFSDPLNVFVHFDKNVPAPQITALGGKEAVKVQAQLQVTAVNGPVGDPREALFAGTPFTRNEQHDLGDLQIAEFHLQFASASYSDARTGAALQPVTRVDSPPAVQDQAPRPSDQTVTTKFKQHDPTDAGDGPDLVGIRLGEPFDAAEESVRKHMKVGFEFQGVRADDSQAKLGFIKPVTSGKLFISEDRKEMIALIDEPPAAPGKVMMAWRRVYIPTNTILPEEVDADAARKYGPPLPGGNLTSGNFVSWSPQGIPGCFLKAASNRFYPLDQAWATNGQLQGIDTGSSQQIAAPRMPVAYSDPLSREFNDEKRCGPTVSITFLKSGRQRDEVDTLLEDFGRYAESFAASRRQLQEQNPETIKESHVKF